MENFLLEGEDLISQSPNSVVILTTHRIRYNAATSSQAHLVSMMLEKVSSCEVRYHSQPALIVIGTVLALLGSVGFAGNGDTQMMGALAVTLGIVLILVYISTRRHIVSIASDGGARIGFETKGMKREAVVSFINGIEKAKVERIERLQHFAASVPVLA
jgi:hypothetical protein